MSCKFYPKGEPDPAIEPVTLFEVLTRGRIDVTTSADEQDIESIMIPAARRYLEHRTGRTFHEKTMEWIGEWFPPFGEPILLHGATPLIAVSSLVYKDTAGTSNTWSASNYIADVDSRIGRIVPNYNVAWPFTVLYPSWPIHITGRAGIAATSPLTEAPSTAKQAVILLVAGMFENRESEVITDKKFMEAVSMKYGVEGMISELAREYAF